MDLFSSLAPELGHENLLHLKTWSNIAPLLQASPAMLAQYIESKELIRRAFLGAEFDGSVPQDALGVALFPPLNTPTSDEDEVRRHARRWALAQLPDPFQHQDHATVECLDRLYDRLSPFMEDYITKATSVFPPRLQFRNKAIGEKVLKVDALSGAERRRLLKAFLKYELLCKIYQMTQRVRPPTPHDDLFAAVFGNRAWEREAIRCVNGRLGFPDHVWFYAEEYFEDAKIQTGPGIIIRMLALCGFDLASALLMLPRDERGWCRRGLVQWLKAIFRRHDRTWSLYRDDVYELLEDWNVPDRKQREECPGIYRALRAGILDSFGDSDFSHDLMDPSCADDPATHLQLRVYRQRARVFFDDARHYPHQNISLLFPNQKQLQREGPDSSSRALRRSQMWQDERRGCHVPSTDRGGSEEDQEYDQGVTVKSFQRGFLHGL
ncbi:hypothetical protein ACJZ2D_000300 [Fusarium nematophilum]